MNGRGSEGTKVRTWGSLSSSQQEQYKAKRLQLVRGYLAKDARLREATLRSFRRALKKQLRHTQRRPIIYNWYKKELLLFEVHRRAKTKLKMLGGNYHVHPIILKLGDKLYILGGEVLDSEGKRCLSPALYSISYFPPYSVSRLADLPETQKIVLCCVALVDAIYVFGSGHLWKYAVSRNQWHSIPWVNLSVTNGNNIGHIFYDRFLYLFIFPSFSFKQVIVWKLDICDEEAGWALVPQIERSAEGPLLNPLWDRMYGTYVLSNNILTVQLYQTINAYIDTRCNEVSRMHHGTTYLGYVPRQKQLLAYSLRRHTGFEIPTEHWPTHTYQLAMQLDVFHS